MSQQMFFKQNKITGRFK